MLTVKGIVIRERPLKDNDKFLDILTDTMGVIEVCAKGVKKPNAKYASVAQVYSYANFCLSEGKSGYILNSAEPIRLFYGIRLDVRQYALASYFSELILFTCVREQPNAEVLRLLLNCLHFLSEESRLPDLMKSVFELRLLSEIGLTPNLIGCCECGEYSKERMQFDLQGGKLYCESCCGPRNLKDFVLIDDKLLHIIRYIVLSELSKLFTFKISDAYLSMLSVVSERYTSIQLGKDFKTLEFYKSLV